MNPVTHAEHIAGIWTSNHAWRSWLHCDMCRVRLASIRNLCVARRIAAGELVRS